eukprot:TRINITY_DN14385_c0_g1_i1.p1 TRINITY_DN14385_c0_g1~~TRINITY_DN14385_c0_g1_i1.p1  ORF type:complete len:690 (-),score=73.37 TRINITY_DN14385_c0_g1_i1:50-2059(-)
MAHLYHVPGVASFIGLLLSFCSGKSVHDVAAVTWGRRLRQNKPALRQDYKVEILSDQIRMIDHCVLDSHRYLPIISSSHYTHASELYVCQKKCALVHDCAYFTFVKTSNRCEFSPENATPIKDSLAMGGPRTCTKVQASCTAKLVSSFPGSTAEKSNLAWQGRQVPAPLQCWPTDWINGVYGDCPTVQVLQELSHGFAGRCSGLTQVPVPLYETCHSICRKMSFCSVYQLTEKGCFIGYLEGGSDCFASQPPDGKVLRAGRYMHGDVRVLMNLRGVQIMGLVQAFQEKDVYGDARTAGVQACRDTCYSNLLCQYWQYALGNGCWVEEPTAGYTVQYPLTTEQFLEGAGQFIAGEYIQHYCPKLGWTPSEEWTLTARNMSCASGGKDLSGSSAVTSSECQARASADKQCGNQIYSNGKACFCILEDSLCERTVSPYNLYTRKWATTQGAEAEPNMSFQDDLYQASRAPSARSFGVEVDCEGLNYNNFLDIYDGKHRFGEEFALQVEKSTGVPRSSVIDLDGKVGAVSVSASTRNSGNTVLLFNTDLESEQQADAVTRGLRSQIFNDRIKTLATQIAPAAITGPVHVVPYFTEAFPDKYRQEDNSWWWLLLLSLALLCTCCLVIICSQKKLRAKMWAGEPLCEFESPDSSDGQPAVRSWRDQRGVKSAAFK